ncbi:DUF2599 domain-containing protein [Corynebacterium sp. CCM 9203]|uniref:DUF2599 domain-containing protein n=1 Tax=Corynebacterium sp. CCM 9203 TaxID=3057615 RepID=UPI003524DC46
MLLAGMVVTAPVAATTASRGELLEDLLDLFPVARRHDSLDLLFAPPDVQAPAPGTRLFVEPDTSTFVRRVDVSVFQGAPRYEITVSPGIARFPDSAADIAWRDATHRGVPNTATLRNQFTCHFHYRALLRTKRTWNLEAARPDKGYEGFIRELCN